MFKRLFYVSISLAGAILAWAPAQAASSKFTIRDAAYEATYVSQSLPDPITLAPGEKKTVVVKFRNSGDTAWKASGAKYISAYAVDPRDRSSVFSSTGWKSKKQTGAIKKATASGEVAELAIELKAPTAPGEYSESFHLAAENYTWVKGGYFFLQIEVSPKEASAKPVTSKEKEREGIDRLTAKAAGYKANLFVQTLDRVTARGGEKIALDVAYQNLGTNTWKKIGFVPHDQTRIAGSSDPVNQSVRISFADDTWASATLLFAKDTLIEPEKVTRQTLQFRAPPKAGIYVAKFDLQADDTIVSGSTVQVPVTVTEDAPAGYEPPFGDSVILPAPSVVEGPAPLGSSEGPPRLTAEPRIRVGIWKPDGFVQFKSDEEDYIVFDGAEQKGMLPKTYLGVLKYDEGLYSFKGAEMEFTTSKYIRLSPANNPHAIFSLLNYTHVVKWRGGTTNFNRYRGAIEYRPIQEDPAKIYIINDILMEDYVAGIGEASNGAPMEYQKALMAAARTYAYFIQQSSNKHDKRNFDVVSHTGDQLYLGYMNEVLAPNAVIAAQATRGFMITYDTEVVVTPYFGHSNGKTRSWTQKWGGAAKPWLVPVVAKYDKGLRMYGHGVGMSQRDAAFRADKDIWDWLQILKHYYTGVEVERMYE